MRTFVLGMLGFCFLAICVLTPLQVLSGINVANSKTAAIIVKSNVPMNVSEEVVAQNTFEIKELDTKDSAIIQLNTEVNETTVDEVIKKMKKANKNTHYKAIYLTLDSPGGNVFDGGRLITAMESSRLPVYTVCTQGCFSMAAQILEHGKERYAVDRAVVMFHPASTSMMYQGEVDKLFSRIEYSKKEIDIFDAYNAKRAGMTYEAFKSKVSKEYWLDSEDALSAHFIDAIVTIDFEKETVPSPMLGNKLQYKVELKD